MLAEPSPFLPNSNIRFAWDSTCLGDFKKCARYYYYVHILGYHPREDNTHLRFGQEFHQALHDYELARKNGNNHEDAIGLTITQLHARIHDWELDTTTKASVSKNKHSLIGSVIAYLDHYVDDPASTVILDNGLPALEVSFKFELDYAPTTANGTPAAQPYVLCGHLDRLVHYPRDSDDMFVMDRKTTTYKLGHYYFDQFEPNNQMTLYAIASQIVLHSPVKGVIIDAISLPTSEKDRQGNQKEVEFGRAITYRNQEQLSEWLEGLKYWLAQASLCAKLDEWPMNENSCGMYGGCRFRNVCSKSPSQREKWLQGDFVQGERWNPLKSR